jgi:FkbM family methyltransferase
VRVVAFEPSASNFAQLVRNVSLNECDGVVTAFAVALDAETAVTTFRYRDLRSGYALHALGTDPGGAPSFRPVASQSVLAFRLDDFIRQFALPSPTHLKIDVDGPELSVLHGAVETLSRATLRSVLIEVDHDRATCGEVFDLMNSLQFKVTERHQNAVPSRPGLVGAFNCVFEKQRDGQ